MDPITVLLGALSVAGTAAKPISDQMIQDSYAALKALILARFGHGHPKLESTLDDYAEDPATYEKPAVKMIRDAGVDADQEVLDTASRLLKHAESRRPGVTGGLVGQLNAQGGRVVVIAQDQVGTLNMGDTLYVGSRQPVDLRRAP